MRGYEAHARVRERPAPRARSTSQSVAGERTMLTPKVLLILADRGVVLDPEAAAVARPPTARCLFGVPDTQEAVNFAEEQLREERERFLSRFGFDILAPYLSEDEDGHHCKARCGPLRRFPHSRQLLITEGPYNFEQVFCNTFQTVFFLWQVGPRYLGGQSVRLPPSRTCFDSLRRGGGHFLGFPARVNRVGLGPLIGEFSRGSPVPPPLAFRRCSIPTSLHPLRISRSSPPHALKQHIREDDLCFAITCEIGFKLKVTCLYQTARNRPAMRSSVAICCRSVCHITMLGDAQINKARRSGNELRAATFRDYQPGKLPPSFARSITERCFLIEPDLARRLLYQQEAFHCAVWLNVELCLRVSSFSPGAAVAERLDFSPPTKANLDFESSVGSLPDFHSYLQGSPQQLLDGDVSDQLTAGNNGSSWYRPPDRRGNQPVSRPWPARWTTASRLWRICPLADRSFALSGDGALDAVGSVALIAYALLGLKRVDIKSANFICEQPLVGGNDLSRGPRWAGRLRGGRSASWVCNSPGRCPAPGSGWALPLHFPCHTSGTVRRLPPSCSFALILQASSPRTFWVAGSRCRVSNNNSSAFAGVYEYIVRKRCVSSETVHVNRFTILVGATVSEWLTYSPPTKAIRVQSPAGSLRIFACGNRDGRCRWSSGFIRDLPFPPPFHSGAAPYSPQSPSSVLKTTMLRRVPTRHLGYIDFSPTLLFQK
ncbi:hypothetical protein PR048_030173, partial [Dryococelus australis]